MEISDCNICFIHRPFVYINVHEEGWIQDFSGEVPILVSYIVYDFMNRYAINNISFIHYYFIEENHFL